MKKLIYDTYYYWFKTDGKHNLRDFIQFVKAVKINKKKIRSAWRIVLCQ